jgi:hypothetical protein
LQFNFAPHLTLIDMLRLLTSVTSALALLAVIVGAAPSQELEARQAPDNIVYVTNAQAFW